MDFGMVLFSVSRGENTLHILYSFQTPSESLAMKHILAVTFAQGKLFPVVFLPLWWLFYTLPRLCVQSRYLSLENHLDIFLLKK